MKTQIGNYFLLQLLVHFLINIDFNEWTIQTPFHPTSTDTLYFRYENDTLIQALAITKLDHAKISFVLTSTNKDRNLKYIVTGKALQKRGDAELDEDIHGIAYLVDEYIYDNKCWLAIRIENKPNNRVTINAANCGHENSYCPAWSVGVLRRYIPK
jgi:hypothetical protein